MTSPSGLTNPWQSLHQNISELVKYWKAAHESTLGLHWKKIPPFSWIFPQVDFLRIQRVTAEIEQQCRLQEEQIQKLLAHQIVQSPDPRSFYAASLDYIRSLGACARLLQRIAAVKHSKLEGKPPNIRDFHQMLKDYETEVQRLRELAGPARQAWISLNTPFIP